MESDQWNFQLLAWARRPFSLEQEQGSETALHTHARKPDPQCTAMYTHHSNGNTQNTAVNKLFSLGSTQGNSHIATFTDSFGSTGYPNLSHPHITHEDSWHSSKWKYWNPSNPALSHGLDTGRNSWSWSLKASPHFAGSWLLSLLCPQPEGPDGSGRKPELSPANAQEEGTAKATDITLSKMMYQGTFKHKRCI